MTTAARFKLVTNATGAALTSAGILTGDGHDRSVRVIRRTLAAADIGNGAGQTQHALGCILDQLPTGMNLLSFTAVSMNSNAAAAGRPIAYNVLDSATLGGAGAHIANLQYFVLPADNTFRVFDNGNDASVLLAAGDFIEVKLTFGPA